MLGICAELLSPIIRLAHTYCVVIVRTCDRTERVIPPLDGVRSPKVLLIGAVLRMPPVLVPFGNARRPAARRRVRAQATSQSIAVRHCP